MKRFWNLAASWALTGICAASPGPPSKVYVTYLGGLYSDTVSGMAVDSSGSQYVAGSTDSPDFPLTSTALGAPLGNQRLRFCHQVQSDGYRNRVFHLCGQLDNPGLRHGCQQQFILDRHSICAPGRKLCGLEAGPIRHEPGRSDGRRHRGAAGLSEDFESRPCRPFVRRRLLNCRRNASKRTDPAQRATWGIGSNLRWGWRIWRILASGAPGVRGGAVKQIVGRMWPGATHEFLL